MKIEQIKTLLDQLSNLVKIIPLKNRIFVNDFEEYESIRTSMSVLVNKSKTKQIKALYRVGYMVYRRNTTLLNKALCYNTAKQIAKEQDSLLLELINQITEIEDLKKMIEIPQNQLSLTDEINFNQIRYSLGTIEFYPELIVNKEKGFVYTEKHLTVYQYKDIEVSNDFA